MDSNYLAQTRGTGPERREILIHSNFVSVMKTIPDAFWWVTQDKEM
jgi:hypothetical protein